jgi:C-terminal processing protease CtpA/Prc
MLLDEEIPNNPVANFNSLWNEFDAKYGLFQVKNIDWDSVYSVYRPQINEQSSADDLYHVLVDMLGGLNDNHVALVPTDLQYPFFQSGIVGRLGSITDFDLEIIKSDYLISPGFEEPFFTYGLLPGNIGYIHIEGFSDMPKNLKKPMSEVLNSLKETKGIVIDVRGGYGGEDLAGRYIAGCFTDRSILYMKTRVKSGAGKDDFTEFEDWYIQPEGDFQYLKPVVVLTHRFTISARETFCLAMKVLPQVTFVGDTTSGAFSNQINRELPNGWGYSLSIGQWVDANGVSYEGKGLAPDVVIQNKKQDVLNGKDEALERAMDILK